MNRKLTVILPEGVAEQYAADLALLAGRENHPERDAWALAILTAALEQEALRHARNHHEQAETLRLKRSTS